jgi:hypothetical protein
LRLDIRRINLVTPRAFGLVVKVLALVKEHVAKELLPRQSE